MNRRGLIIIISLIILLGFVGAFWFLSRTAEPETKNPTSLTIKEVLDERVISPVGSFDNNSIWYFNSAGRLFKSNADGSSLSEFPIPSLPDPNPSNVLWPVVGSDFITISVNGGVVSKNFFDSKTKIYVSLEDNIQWLEWLPDGKRVVYVWQSDDKKSQQLVVANADGAGYKNIASLFWPDLVLKASPDGNTVLMYRGNVTGDANKIYAANITTGVITTLVEQGKNTAANWLPVGNKFLFNQGSKVYLFDVLNKLTTDLKLETSLDKTVVDSSGKTLYAAVAKKDKTGDMFVKISLSSGISEIYYEPTTEIRVKKMMLLGNTLYFVDSRDNRLYMVSK